MTTNKHRVRRTGPTFPALVFTMLMAIAAPALPASDGQLAVTVVSSAANQASGGDARIEIQTRSAARQARIDMNVPRRKRGGHLDEIAATVILQTYLNHRSGDH